ncbi:MAG: ribose 5-phosphate isomerase B [Anaerolineales bacterium]|nr:ribose 5-phosphate isomerase B [Anaerolineales bacterium]
MRVAIAADHAGFPLKERVIQTVRAAGHEPIDLGTNDTQPVDYPDFAEKVGGAVQRGEAERGIILCGSGVGASIAANKLKGIRSGVCHDTYTAHQGVEHDDMNVLAIGGRVIGPELAVEIVRAYLGAKYTGEERHARRVGKVQAIEARGVASK